MATYILHRKDEQSEDVYQIYGTIADGPYFVSGLTRDQLNEYYRSEHGEQGMRDLEQRLARAHAKGTSAHMYESLKETIGCNRAGPNETTLSYEEFVKQYLTLDDSEETYED